MTLFYTGNPPGTDFTAIYPAILVDINGQSGGKQIVSTQTGTDFTSIVPCIQVNTNGQA